MKLIINGKIIPDWYRYEVIRGDIGADVDKKVKRYDHITIYTWLDYKEFNKKYKPQLDTIKKEEHLKMIRGIIEGHIVQVKDDEIIIECAKW